MLDKKLSVLEFDSQRNEKYKESLKDNNDLETENIGAINFEIENLRKLILDYDNKLLDKKNLLRKMQNDLKNIGNNTRYCLENVYEIETKNKQLQKELDQIKMKEIYYISSVCEIEQENSKTKHQQCLQKQQQQ